MSCTRRAARGFTVLEVAVTLALTATVFAFILPWLTNLITASTASLNAAPDRRTVAAIDRTLGGDLGSLVTCPQSGSPVDAAEPGMFAVFTATPDGVALVAWSLHEGTLSRAQVPASVSSLGCGPVDPLRDPVTDPASVAWVVIGDGVVAGDAGPGWALHALTGAVPEDVRAVVVDLRVGQGGHLVRTYPFAQVAASLS